MKRFFSVIIFIVFLLEARFFYLISLPSSISMFNTYHNKLIIVLIIFISLLMLLATKDKQIINKSGYFNSFIIMWMILIAIECLFSYLNYSQGIRALILATHASCIILLYYLLVYSQNKFNSIAFLKNIIILFGTILAVLFLLQASVYNAGGSFFLSISELETLGIESRLGRVRITYPSTLISISVLLSFAETLKGNKINKKCYHIISTILCFLYLVVVCQTRMLIICVLLSMLLTIIIKYSKNVTKSLLTCLILSLVIIWIFQLDYTKDFIGSFSDNANKISSVARSGAVEYFLEQGLENIGFGRGFILVTGMRDQLQFLAEGPMLTYKITDVGIVGLFAVFGILGVVWYVWLMIRLLRYLITFYRENLFNECIELFSLYIFIITTSATLICTDSQRIIILPVTLAIFDYYLHKMKQNKINQIQINEKG